MLKQDQQLKRERTSSLINWGHWFAFFNGLLAFVIGFRYLADSGSPEGILGWGYFLISSFGHFAFLAFLVYVLFLFPVTLLLPFAGFLRGYAALVATIALSVLLFDVQVFKAYGIHLSPFAFDLAYADLNQVISRTNAALTLAFIITIELVAANWIWRRINKIQKKNFGNKAIAAVAVCFFGSHLIHIWADISQETRITRQDVLLPLSYPATARSFMAEHGFEQDNTQITDASISQLNYPLEPLQCRGMAKQPNLLMVVVDGWRADMVNADTMPFFSDYAQQNRSFNQHFAGGGRSDTGLFSLMFGLQGSYLDAVVADDTVPVLNQVFGDLGYQLNLFSANPYDIGSRWFEGFEVHPLSPSINQADNDKQLIKRYQDWQAPADAPWLNMVRLSGPASYDTPEGFVGIATTAASAELNVAERILFNQYRQALRALDKRLEELLSQQAQDTHVIVTGINGLVFSSDATINRRDLSPASVHVPLVVSWPNSQPDAIDYATSHHGIVPTLLSRAALCDNPASDYSSGSDLLQRQKNAWVYAGHQRNFAIYQPNRITLINRHGNYRIFDTQFQRQRGARLHPKPLMEVMNEGQRFYDR
ncbi:DUF3413 domain-containing protein [Paraferrimonas sedimenticola]|uniref:Sulfatase n=1 Tax=Paraferrimonas sedimenticola TaxID=375674 RepID=A0AA37W2E9_9GAMM|nr:DUF3413 domain-containing protein [Paraferrimonas sedimenticola]GLP97990.1 sulfatase [Paraferrimonas sedimenticola]